MIEPKQQTLKKELGNAGSLVWVTILLAGLSIGGFIATTLWLVFHEPDPVPWGSYPDGVAFVGQLDEESGVITRFVDENGRPIVNSENPQLHTVRCGPTVPIEVISQRFWLVGDPSDRSELERFEGEAAPFLFQPAAEGEPDCRVVSFDSVTVDKRVLDFGDHPFRFQLVISPAVDDGFLPVSLVSEAMVFGNPEDGAPSQVRITAAVGE